MTQLIITPFPMQKPLIVSIWWGGGTEGDRKELHDQGEEGAEGIGDGTGDRCLRALEAVVTSVVTIVVTQ